MTSFDTPTSGSNASRSLRGLLAFIVLVSVVLVVATVWQDRQAREVQLRTAQTAVSNIANSISRQAEDAIQQADNVLIELSERVAEDGLGPDQQGRLSRLMRRHVQVQEGLQGLFIYDEKGNWMATSFGERGDHPNNSDRNYFTYHQGHADTDVHISPVIVSRTTGEVIIPISRRLEHADGSFAGVVLATIPVSYFEAFFHRLALDDKGVIFLAMHDGTLLVRRPGATPDQTNTLVKGEIFSRYLPVSREGTAMVTSVVDGVTRMYGYTSSDRFPLVAAAGLSKQAILADWELDAYRDAILMGAVVVALGLLGALLYRQIGRAERAQARLSQAYRELESLAQSDSLTGVANRRRFDAALQVEFARTMRTGSSLGVILLDIDFFKQFNDTYGHVAGDTCLREVAAIVSRSVRRPGDLVARYGGEEFVVLLPDTEIAGALAVAEQIRLGISEAYLEHRASALGRVSISGGVHAVNKVSAGTLTSLLEVADAALYLAKQNGRNRICQEADRPSAAVVKLPNRL